MLQVPDEAARHAALLEVVVSRIGLSAEDGAARGPRAEELAERLVEALPVRLDRGEEEQRPT